VDLNATDEKVWEKITGRTSKMGRTAAIPLYDQGTWRIVHNTHTIWPNLENAADPTKVDQLRRNANALLEHFPETIVQLERLGTRVKGLLSKPIRTPEDVKIWADSMFNTGPIDDVPAHVSDALALVYDDFNVQVQGGRHPIWVLPAAPRGSGVVATLDFSAPGSRIKYGPRHPFTKTALSQQLPPSDHKRTKPAGTGRPRGRPRKDGLVPGSREAKAADKKKRLDAERAKALRAKEREQARATKVPSRVVKTKPMPPQEGPSAVSNGEVKKTRRVLARVGGEAA
jgi:Family of unknown function (DUF6424)